MAGKPCVDCAPGSKRPTPHPGPRCATHHRAVRKARRSRAHQRYVARTYGVTEDFYERLLAEQGGVCAICRRATGASKKLAVDHDHACCPGPTSCGQCVRGLLCSRCNHDVLGHCRDDPAMLRRGATYLERPPAAALLIAADEGVTA